MIEEHFYCNHLKLIKGACAQLIDGEGAVSALYNITEGEYIRELVIKGSFCRKDASSSYVAGVHFIVEDLIIFGVNKKLKGCQIWAMELTVLRSTKKALAMVPKISPSIILIDKNFAVLSFTSGKNESLFMQYIDNRMYPFQQLLNGELSLLMKAIWTTTMRYSGPPQRRVCHWQGMMR